MKLFPFQVLGVEWLKSKKFALLADEMRLGKTPQVICALRTFWNHNILVICPAVARTNWAREFIKWEFGSANAQIVSFEYAVKHFANLKFFLERTNAALVIDEVHFLKSVDAKRTKAIFGYNGLAHYAERVWCLSGTPAPNHVGELWVMLYVFGVTKLNYDSFIRTYCDTEWNGFGLVVHGTNKKRIPELKEMLKPIMLRRTLKNVMPEIPDLTVTEFTVEPGFVDVSKELQEKLDREIGMMNDFLVKDLTFEEQIRMLEALAESVSTLRRYSGLQKIVPAIELIDGELNLNLYPKIVVFANHREVVERLHLGLAKWGAVRLYGGMSPAEKQISQDRFLSDPACRVFIGNILTAGTNLNLSSSDQIVFVEQDWVPGNNLQAARRCTNLLRTDKVFVRTICLDNEMDRKIVNCLNRKILELSKVFDT